MSNLVDPLTKIRAAKLELTAAKYATRAAQLMEEFIPVDELGYSTICYSATRIFEGETPDTHEHVTAIYGFVHIQVVADEKHVYVCPKYMCAGPTFTSMDGEYRKRFIPFGQLLEAREKFPDIWKEAEAVVLSKLVGTFDEDDEYTDHGCIQVKGGGELARGDTTLHADVVLSPDHAEYTKVLQTWADESRMAIHLFVAAWILDGFKLFRNLMENHVHIEYRAMLYDKEDDAFFFEKHTTGELFGKLNNCMLLLDQVKIYDFTSVNVSDELACGQKITPLTIQEVMTNDVALGIWKEIIVGRMCANLVLNGCAPGFPITGGWFFLQNVDRRIFDNEAMHERFVVTESMGKINEMLRTARDEVWHEGNAGSADLDSLAKQINEALRFSSSYITTTDVALVAVTQWVGWTVRDYPRLVKMASEKKLRSDWSTTNMFSVSGLFVKFLFDYVYSFHAMNIQLRALHGDIHLNNVTIHRFGRISRPDPEGPHGEKYLTGGHRRPVAVYLVSEEPTGTGDADGTIGGGTDGTGGGGAAPAAYVFESYMMVGALIDFSRAIIADLDSVRHVLPDALPDIEFAQRRQEALLFRLLHRCAPEMVDGHEARVRALIIENFALMHKIACAADPLMTAEAIGALMEAEFGAGPHATPAAAAAGAAKFNMPAVPEILRTLRLIIVASQEYIHVHLLRAINHEARVVDDVPWPGPLIIKAAFRDWLISAHPEYFVVAAGPPGPTAPTPTEAKGSAGTPAIPYEFDANKFAFYDLFEAAAPLRLTMTDIAARVARDPASNVPENANEATRAMYARAAKNYLAVLKNRPIATAHLAVLRSRFQRTGALPVKSTWRYDR